MIKDYIVIQYNDSILMYTVIGFTISHEKYIDHQMKIRHVLIEKLS